MMPSGRGYGHVKPKHGSGKTKIAYPKNKTRNRHSYSKIKPHMAKKRTKTAKRPAGIRLHKALRTKGAQEKKTTKRMHPNQDVHAIVPKSINEALILDILGNRNSGTTSGESVLLAQILSGFTKSMRKLSYMAGISNGMFLYRINKLQKRYAWYQDSVKDISEFFEKAGYMASSYDIFPDKVVIKLYGAGPNLGGNMHVFESGVISGFLTAAIGHYVPVSEEECGHAGASYCRFSTSNYKAASDVNEDNLRHINALAKYISDSKPTAKPDTFSKSYLNLIYQVIMEREYLDNMKDLLGYFGEIILQMSNAKKPKKLKGGELASLAQRNINLLNLGKLNIKSANALDAELMFDSSQSRSEFVELAVAFLSGVLGKDMVRATKLKSENDLYSIRINKKNK